MIEAKTESGFAFKFDEELADDMEFLEKIAEIDSGNLSVMGEVLVDVLGTEQKKALYNFCRNEKGRVSARRVLQEFKAIFEAAAAESKRIKN